MTYPGIGRRGHPESLISFKQKMVFSLFWAMKRKWGCGKKENQIKNKQGGEHS
jgi:hypothetical protein